MEPSIHRIHEQDAGARMEHPGVALWHLSGLETLPGEGGTPMSPKHQLCASNCCIGIFSCLQGIHDILSHSLML